MSPHPCPASGVGGEEGGILFSQWEPGPTKRSLLLPDGRTEMQQSPPAILTQYSGAMVQQLVGERREGEASHHTHTVSRAPWQRAESAYRNGQFRRWGMGRAVEISL